MHGNPDTPSARRLLAQLARCERAEAALLARRIELLNRLAVAYRAAVGPDAAEQFLSLEVAGACHVGQFAAALRITEAARFAQDLPRTVARLAGGQLTVAQARVVEAETQVLADADCAAVEVALYGPREEGSPEPTGSCELPPVLLRRAVRRHVLQANPAAAELRRNQARQERRVWTRPAPDGMGFLGATMSADDLFRFRSGLEEISRLATCPGDSRTGAQRRVDVLACLPDLVLQHLVGAEAADPPGTTPTRRRAVQCLVHIPVGTALGVTEEPGELVGYGPITAGHARDLLATAELRKVCVAPATGRVIMVEPDVVRPDRADPTALAAALRGLVTSLTRYDPTPETQHDPSTALARTVRTRDRFCSGPGCSQPAHRCELDHVRRWPEGPTSAANLDAKSPRCHHAKHAGWQLTRHDDGSLTWVSPVGARYHRASLDHPPQAPPHAPPEPPPSDPPLPDPPQDPPAAFPF